MPKTSSTSTWISKSFRPGKSRSSGTLVPAKCRKRCTVRPLSFNCKSRSCKSSGKRFASRASHILYSCGATDMATIGTRDQTEIKFLCPEAKLPTLGSKGAAGYDLYAVKSATVPARGRTLVGTGISIGFIFGMYGRLASRSGLALKHGIEVGAGVIDEDYTGEIKVLLHNHSDTPFEVKVGDRIAQILVCRSYGMGEVKMVTDELKSEPGGRGDKGFGSTGIGHALTVHPVTGNLHCGGRFTVHVGNADGSSQPTNVGNVVHTSRASAVYTPSGNTNVGNAGNGQPWGPRSA